MKDARKIICNFEFGLRNQSFSVLDATNRPISREEFVIEDLDKKVEEMLKNPQYQEINSIIFCGAKFMKDRAFAIANQIKNTQFKDRKLEIIKI